MFAHSYAVRAGFSQQWRTLFRLRDIFVTTGGAIAPIVGLAWIARQSTSNEVLAHVALGSFLYNIWWVALFNFGWALTGEMALGTFEFNILSRSDIVYTMFGKAMAQILRGFFGGIISFLTVLVIAQRTFEVENYPLLIVSMVVGIVALTATSFLFAPLQIVARGQGFHNVFVFLGAAFSGFYYPLSRLPLPLEILGKCTPISWAMEAAIHATNGDAVSSILYDCLVSLVISMVWFALTVWMFRVIERRLTASGEIASA